MLTLLALLSAPAEAATYTLSPAQSQLYVIIRNDTSTLASGFGHDHAISAEQFTGTVEWDEEAPNDCAVSIEFPVQALEVDPPGLREHAGLDPDGAVSESAKSKIKANFLKKNQLWADRYPTISYTSTACEGIEGRVTVTGDLTIRGVTNAITVPLQITLGQDGTFRAKGRFTSSHTAFGFEPYSNLIGALKNQDELDFVLDVRGRAG